MGRSRWLQLKVFYVTDMVVFLQVVSGGGAWTVEWMRGGSSHAICNASRVHK